jgi:hypothetical protein
LVQRDEVMPADRALAVLELPFGGIRLAKGDRLLPGDLAPGLVDRLADHRVEDAVLVVGVAPGEAALDAGMAAIGLAVLVGHHADQLPRRCISALNEQPTPQ